MLRHGYNCRLNREHKAPAVRPPIGPAPTCGPPITAFRFSQLDTVMDSKIETPVCLGSETFFAIVRAIAPDVKYGNEFQRIRWPIVINYSE